MDFLVRFVYQQYQNYKLNFFDGVLYHTSFENISGFSSSRRKWGTIKHPIKNIYLLLLSIIIMTNDNFIDYPF